MATGDDSFKPIQLGGHNIDLDNLHSVCDSGTIDTVSNVAAGSIIVTAGTISEMPEVVIAAGTADLGEIDITGGTINLLVAGTVTEVGNIASGTIAEVTSVSNIVAGTLNEIEGVTNIAALDLLKAGTVTSIGNVAGGTLDEVTGVTNVANLDVLKAGTVDVSEVPAYATPNNGELACATSATQFPSVSCREALLRVYSGTVYLGDASVEAPAGTADNANAGFKLTESDEPVKVPVSNLNVLYGKADAGTVSVMYLAFS